MKIKNGKLYVYDVKNEYRDYLRQFDKRVSKKENRRFYGIIITKDKIQKIMTMDFLERYVVTINY